MSSWQNKKKKSPNAPSYSELWIFFLLLQASPGNLTQFEEILFGTSDLSNSVGVIAVKLASDNGQRVRFLV